MKERSGEQYRETKKEGRRDRQRSTHQTGHSATRAGAQAPRRWSRPLTGGYLHSTPTGSPSFPCGAGPYQHSGSSPSTPLLGDFAASQTAGRGGWREGEGGGRSLLDSKSTGPHPRPALTRGYHRDPQEQTSDSPGSHKDTWAFSHQCVPHSHPPVAHMRAHTQTEATCTRVSIHAHLQRDSHGWTGRGWLSEPSWPGYLSPGGHRKGLPETAENVSGSIQSRRGFLFQLKS